jgi:hypothetical protein
MRNSIAIGIDRDSADFRSGLCLRRACYANDTHQGLREGESGTMHLSTKIIDQNRVELRILDSPMRGGELLWA